MRVSIDRKTDVFSKNNTPVLSCKVGDIVTFETIECYDGTIGTDLVRRIEKHNIRNPSAGPVYIEGVNKGDILCAEIISLKTANFGYVGCNFGRGLFTELEGETTYKKYDVVDGCVDVEGKKIPIKPMIGVIGVAPEGEGIPTLLPGDHGGNMDCSIINEGAKVYLPVKVDGALFGVGDVHIIMGDGEVFGYGIESCATIDVKFSVIRGKEIKAPVVYENGLVHLVISEKTLDEATKRAVLTMHSMLVEAGYNDTDAGRILTLDSNLTICQAVSALKTVRISLDSYYFKNKR